MIFSIFQQGLNRVSWNLESMDQYLDLNLFSEHWLQKGFWSFCRVNLDDSEKERQTEEMEGLVPLWTSWFVAFQIEWDIWCIWGHPWWWETLDHHSYWQSAAMLEILSHYLIYWEIFFFFFLAFSVSFFDHLFHGNILSIFFRESSHKSLEGRSN